MKKYIISSVVLVLCFCFGSAVFGEMSGASYRIRTSAFSGTAGLMASAGHKSNSSMGQPSSLMDPSDPPVSAGSKNFPGFWHTATDNDGDGLLNALEDTVGLDSGDADYDDDGILDGMEDTDHDGIVDNDETDPGDADSEDDGMPDGWEVQYDLDPLFDDAGDDDDEDGFSNLKEYLRGTDPSDSSSHPPRSMPWLPLLLEDN